MGLAQQVAYSSLLAFFPAVVFLVGFLGLVGAFDALQEFLEPVAPQRCRRSSALQRGFRRRGSVALIALGLFGALWAASGAMGSIVKAVNRAYGRIETRPFWKVRLIALLLVASG